MPAMWRNMDPCPAYTYPTHITLNPQYLAMSYHHKLRVHFRCQPEVTADHIIEALAPLSNYFEWTHDQLLSNSLNEFGDLRFWHGPDGLLQVNLSTFGLVGDSFEARVRAAADNLTLLVQPSVFIIRAQNSPDIRIWFGKGSQSELARRHGALLCAMDLLKEGGYSPNELALIRDHIEGLVPEHEPNDH